MDVLRQILIHIEKLTEDLPSSLLSVLLLLFSLGCFTALHRGVSAFRRFSVSLDHTVAHTDFGEDILRLCGIFLDLAADIGHVYP